jgi:deoxycytidine triphosphate deaminase
MSFVNPRKAIENGWITGIKNEVTQVQPNAIDFTLDRLFSIQESNPFVISTDKTTGKEVKQMRGGFERTPITDRATNLDFFVVDPRTSYDMMSDIYIKVPEGYAALLVTRSTFVRNGLFIVSGLYDSGFEGHIGCVLHNLSGTTRIERGTRIGQVIFTESENAGKYSGGWNHGKGTFYTESAHGSGVAIPS